MSAALAARFSHIAFEKLNIKGLAAGMLAKSVHNAAWNQVMATHMLFVQTWLNRHAQSHADYDIRHK
jgi:tRNA1(Val) A37 N6-methylase TrmN6